MVRDFHSRDVEQIMLLGICGYSRSKRQVRPIHNLNLHPLFPIMTDLSNFDCIGYKDFDLSFITDYERDVLSGQNISSPKRTHDQRILRIFNESSQSQSFSKLALFIDMLMQKYGLIFIKVVVDDLNGEIKTPQVSMTPLAPLKNKIVVFVDDPPTLETRLSWMGRMVTVGLLSCGILPLLIPWNDLLRDEDLVSILAELRPFSPQKESSELVESYNWILRKGFSLALTCSNKDVIIVDVDWSKVKMPELIKQAEAYGYELLFMKNHVEINRGVFVQTVINRIKTILTDQFGVQVKPLIEHEHVVVNVVKHQESQENQDQDHARMQSSANTSNDKAGSIERNCHESLEIQNAKCIKTTNSNLKLPDTIDSIPPTFTRSRNSWTRFLSRIFNNTTSDSRSVPNPNVLSTKKKSVFTLPKLFHRGNDGQSDDKSLYEIDECQQQIFNPHVIPRLTDKEFDKIFVQPKLFAKRTEMEEKDLFTHSQQDLDDLDLVFSNSI